MLEEPVPQFNNSVVKVGNGIVSTVARAPTGPSTIPAAFAAHYGVASDGPCVGLESGKNYLKGCATNILDLSLQRNIELGGGRKMPVPHRRVQRAEHADLHGPQLDPVHQQPDEPDDSRQHLDLHRGPANPGTYMRDTSRDKPQDAGFGAVTKTAALRTIQMQLRFQFLDVYDM